jgi:mRNA interferase MazF
VKRGDIVILAPPSPFNKPRPALVIQARVLEESENITVALITSDLLRMPGLRIPILPSAENGLRKPFEVMVDHVQTVPVDRIGLVIGSMEAEVLSRIGTALQVFLGLL